MTKGDRKDPPPKHPKKPPPRPKPDMLKKVHGTRGKDKGR
jgi:hypothetical protein